MTEIPFKNTIRIMLLITSFVIVVFGSIILGVLSYRGFKKEFRKDVENNLNAISNLKVAEIVQWRKERIGDGFVFLENKVFTDLVSRFIASPSDPELNEMLGTWLRQVRSASSYERILLLDTRGQELLSEPLDTIPVPSHLINDINAVRTTQKITFLDFQRDEPGGPVRLGILIPVQDGDNSDRIIAMMIFVINPEIYLYPLINNWPTTSRTAETLLLRREGDSVLFLNELRFLKNTALNLRFSINNTHLPAARAALGNKGIFTGIDYRGVPVISSLNAIPESPWFMVTRIDIKEIFTPLKSRWWTVFMIEALLILSFASFMYSLWRRQKIRYFRENYEIEKDKAKTIEALAESERKFRETIKYLDEGYYSVTPEGLLLEHNRAFNRILGFDIDQDLKGSILPDFWQYPEDRKAYLQELMTKGFISNFLINTKKVSGEMIVVMANSHLVKDEKGKFVRIEGTYNDITDRNRAEKSLLLQKRIGDIFLTVQDDEMFNEVLKIILDLMQSPFGVFGYLDDTGALVVPSMTRHIWDKCQVAEKTFIFSKDTWGNSSWPRAIRERKLNYSNEISVKTPEGHITLTRHISLPILFHGEVIGLFQVANKETDYTNADINTLEAIAEYIAPVLSARLQRQLREKEIHQLNKELEQRVSVRTSQLEAANKELEAFSYSVSHDLRAPLRAVDGFSKFVLEDYGEKLDSEGKRMLGLIRSNTQKMDQLITDLLNLSRVSRRDLQYSEIDMTQLALSMYNESAPGALKDNINLKIDKLPEVFADPVFIKQVWINLLSNAIKFTSKKRKPEIRISGKIEPLDVTYSIKDNGAGFNQQYVNKLFGVFQRLHKSDDFEGTGVGLAIVQRIIHRHRGKVWAEGVEGKGATFYFSLPVKQSGS